MANEAALIVRGVSKRFRRRQVLVDVSFDLERAEVVAVTGENGSGESTLMRIIVGLLRADAGTVEIHGRIGHCEQRPLLFPDLTVAEHFRYLACAYRLPEVLWMAERDVLLGQLGFQKALDRRVSELSGGTCQKLHLALALLHRPDVVVLDEPYQSFDWETYVRFWECVEDLRRRAAAVLLVTHLAHEMHRFDRVVELREGRLR